MPRSRTFLTLCALLVVGLTGASLWARSRFALQTGLRQAVYQTGAFDGQPVARHLSDTIDLTFLERDPSLPRRFFTVRWDGYWFVGRDRLVDIRAGADERVVVRLDDRVVVDRHNAADVDVATGPVPVARGWHHLAVEYEQTGGGYDLRVVRALDGGEWEPFDRNALFPDQPPIDAIQKSRWVMACTNAVGALWVLWFTWLVGRWVARRLSAPGHRWPAVSATGTTLMGVVASPMAGGTVLVLAAGLLLVGASGGPDYWRYIDWAYAYLFGDIFMLPTRVASPLGLPLTQWSHGPGLILSLGKFAVDPMVDVNVGALIIGWLAALVFWWSLFRVLRWAADGNTVLVVCSLGAAFVGTHAGFYSHHHASESLSLALVGVLTLAVIERRDAGPAQSAIVGAAAALLLVTRANLAFYAAPALVWQGFVILNDDRGTTWLRRGLACALLAIPVAMAVSQLAIVNRWMTGSLMQSPYAFGNDTFRSLDWARPEILAVLFHPWHGLFVYHPIYALGLVALVVMGVTASSSRARWLCLAALAPMLANIYTQSAWYVWWMGTDTFGSRGLTVMAIPVMAALTRLLAVLFRRSRPAARGLLLAVALSSGWSFLLLRQGTSEFLTYGDLLDSQLWVLTALIASPLLIAVAALPVAVVLAGLRWRRPAPAMDGWLTAAATLLGALTFVHLLGLADARGWYASTKLAAPALLLFVALWSVRALAWSDEQRAGGPLVRLGIGATFVATAAIFLSLAVRTERRLSAGDLPSDRFWTTATYLRAEVLASYNEYQRVPGFEDKKRALRDFLSLEVRAPGESVDDADKNLTQPIAGSR